MKSEVIIREASAFDADDVFQLESVAFGGRHSVDECSSAPRLGGVVSHKIVEYAGTDSAVIATAKVYGLNVTASDRGSRVLYGGGDIAFSPCHQGQGTFRRLFEELLTDASEMAAHYFGGVPSQARIYGRFELAPVASFNCWEFNPAELKIVSGAPYPLDLREVRYEDSIDLLIERYRAFAHQVPGSVHRPDDWWLSPALMYGRFQVEASDSLFAVVGKTSFMTFVQRDSFIEVLDFCATQMDEVAQLLVYLGRLQLADKVVLRVPCSVRPELLLDNPSAGSLVERVNSLWLRPIAASRILNDRSWECDGDFVIEVTDSVGISDGRWRVNVNSGEVAVEETLAAPDLIVPASRLAQLDLGYCSASDLVAYGLATKGSRDVLGIIDLMFGKSRVPFSVSSY